MVYNNARGTDTPTVPHIDAPENVTRQNMWVWEFNRIKDLITKCDLAKEECFMFKSDYVLRYKATLETLSLAFAKFLKEDFSKEKIIIEQLFDKFNDDYFRSKRVGSYGGDNEVNKLLMSCIKTLKSIDELLSIIRQKKGFGIEEQVSFVINERARRAITINNNAGKELLKIFKAQDRNKKPKADKTLEKVKSECMEVLNNDISDTGSETVSSDDEKPSESS